MDKNASLCAYFKKLNITILRSKILVVLKLVGYY